MGNAMFADTGEDVHDKSYGEGRRDWDQTSAVLPERHMRPLEKLLGNRLWIRRCQRCAGIPKKQIPWQARDDTQRGLAGDLLRGGKWVE
jgi:hypothetical protein